MADNDVKIKVSLDGADQVQKGLNGISSGASDADSKLGKLVSGGLKGAGAAVVGFTAAAAAAGAGLAAGVVSQYAQYEQNIGGIETLFKGSAGKMEQYASQAYKTAGLSANEYMSQVTSFSSALLQGLGGDTDKAAEVANRAMTDMSDNANKFGTNIGMIQNAYQGFAKQNFTMLDNLKLGYGGTREEMARLVNDSGVMGDSFTATAANINEVSYDQIIAAIGAVQDKMGITGTTAKEAASTITGSVDTLKGAFANLLTGLGSADADVATLAGNVITSFQQVVTNITPVIQNLGKNIGTLGPQLGSMMEGLVGALASAIPAVLDAGVALVGGLISGITSALPSLITALVPGVISLVQTLATLGPQLVQAGAQAIVQLATGLAGAAPTLIPVMVTGILNMVSALLNAAPQLITAGIQLIQSLATGLLQSIPILLGYLPGLVQQLVSFFNSSLPVLIQAGIQLFTSLITALPEIITTIVAALPQIITSVIDAVLGAIPLLIDAGIQLLVSLVENLPAIITGIVQAIPKIITSVLNAVIGAIPQLINAGIKLFIALIQNLPTIIATIVGAIPQIIGGIVGAIVGAVPQLAKAGLQLIQGLWQGISDAYGWLMGQIGGFVDSVVGGIKDFFGIHSPSKVMAELGKYVVQGFAVGIKGTASQVESATQSLVKKAQKAFEEGLITKKTRDLITTQLNWNNKLIQKALADRVKLLDKLKDAQKKLQDLRDDRAGFIDSIRDKAANVDIADNKTVDSMKDELSKRITAVKEFRDKLSALQKLGLDDTTRDQLLQEFLSSGKSGAADALLAGGADAVKQVADLQTELSKAGTSLGTLVGDDMYNAGIKAAEGLVKGLQSQEKQLAKVAKTLADNLVRAVKSELKIKSPSRRFQAEVGAMVPSGIGLGVADNAAQALRPIEALTSRMVKTAQASMVKGMMPMRATAQQVAPASLKAHLDPAALAGAFASAMPASDAAPVTLSKESVNALASALYDALRVNSRQGGVTLG